jgi:hypothetical protein
LKNRLKHFSLKAVRKNIFNVQSRIALLFPVKV